jgi:hypothetical protein
VDPYEIADFLNLLGMARRHIAADRRAQDFVMVNGGSKAILKPDRIHRTMQFHRASRAARKRL